MEEVFCLTKSEREYLVVIRDPQKKISKDGRMEDICVSAADCRRLMLEAVQLISGLHTMGLVLRCPIHHFVQIAEGGKQGLRLPRVSAPISYDYF